MTGKQPDRVGTTMVEVVISTLLIGIVTVAALDAVGSAVRSARLGADKHRGSTIAHSLMAEILAMSYEDPDDTAPVLFGIESNEPQVPGSRSAFDDIDDYRNWSSAPMEIDGTPLDNTTGWNRAVTVEKLSWGNPSTTLPDGSPDEGIRRIGVTVTDPQGDTTVLYAIRSAVGAVEQLPGVDTEFVTGVVVELNTDGQITTHGANLMNHATGP